jgi:hypothetical protein
LAPFRISDGSAPPPAERGRDSGTGRESTWVAVLMEPSSPELCLVCPELRERALAELPDFALYCLPPGGAPVAELPRVVAIAPKSDFLPAWILRLVAPAAAAAASATVLTLALTLIADALR